MAIDPNSRSMSRREAVVYLDKRGCPTAYTTLCKLACIGGGPLIIYFGKRPRYTPKNLDAWADARTSPPVRSKSEARRLAWPGAQP